MKYCSYCSIEIPSDARFCGKCGKELIVETSDTDKLIVDTVFEEPSVKEKESVESELLLKKNMVPTLIENFYSFGTLIMVGAFLLASFTPSYKNKEYHIFNVVCIGLQLIIIKFAFMTIGDLKIKVLLGLKAERDCSILNIGINVVALVAISIVALIIFYQGILYNWHLSFDSSVIK